MCGWLNNVPSKYAHVLIPGTCEGGLPQKRHPYGCGEVQDVEMGRLSWTIQMAPMQPHVPVKGEAGWTHRGEAGMETELPASEAGVTGGVTSRAMLRPPGTDRLHGPLVDISPPRTQGPGRGGALR